MKYTLKYFSYGELLTMEDTLISVVIFYKYHEIINLGFTTKKLKDLYTCTPLYYKITSCSSNFMLFFNIRMS